MDLDKLVEDVLTDKVAIELLTDEELDLVFDRIQDVAEGLLDSEHHEVAVAMLEVLSNAIDERVVAEDMSEFEDAITEAELRGSVYWEFDDYSIH